MSDEREGPSEAHHPAPSDPEITREETFLLGPVGPYSAPRLSAGMLNDDGGGAQDHADHSWKSHALEEGAPAGQRPGLWQTIRGWFGGT